jgi:hypothetical protein
MTRVKTVSLFLFSSFLVPVGVWVPCAVEGSKLQDMGSPLRPVAGRVTNFKR